MKNRYKFLLASILAFHVVSRIQRKNDNPRIWYLDKLPFGYNGFIVPPFGVFILKSQRDNEQLRLHELVHWKQYQREGFVKFLYGYSIENKKKGYDKNPYEIEARFCEDDFCKTNYTYCVRNGISNTVHNTNFRN